MKIEIIEQTIVLDLNERHEKAKCRISRLLANKRTNTRAGSLRAVSGLFLVFFYDDFGVLYSGIHDYQKMSSSQAKDGKL